MPFWLNRCSQISGGLFQYQKARFTGDLWESWHEPGSLWLVAMWLSHKPAYEHLPKPADKMAGTRMKAAPKFSSPGDALTNCHQLKEGTKLNIACFRYRCSQKYAHGWVIGCFCKIQGFLLPRSQWRRLLSSNNIIPEWIAKDPTPKKEEEKRTARRWGRTTHLLPDHCFQQQKLAFWASSQKTVTVGDRSHSNPRRSLSFLIAAIAHVLIALCIVPTCYMQVPLVKLKESRNLES